MAELFVSVVSGAAKYIHSLCEMLLVVSCRTLLLLLLLLLDHLVSVYHFSGVLFCPANASTLQPGINVCLCVCGFLQCKCCYRNKSAKGK